MCSISITQFSKLSVLLSFDIYPLSSMLFILSFLCFFFSWSLFIFSSSKSALCAIIHPSIKQDKTCFPSDCCPSNILRDRGIERREQDQEVVGQVRLEFLVLIFVPLVPGPRATVPNCWVTHIFLDFTSQKPSPQSMLAGVSGNYSPRTPGTQSWEPLF